MSKISALPIAGPLDGSETIPLVQNGATARANLGEHIGSLAQPYIEQTKAARDIAQAAVGVSYLSEAAALAGSVDGDKFTYWDGENIIFARNDSGTILPLSGPWIDEDKVGEKTVSALLASPEAARGEGSLWKAGNHRYKEASSGATDHHLITAGEVKLYVLPSSDGYLHTSALGNPSGTDDTTKIAALVASAENGGIVFDYHVMPYTTGNLVPPANFYCRYMPGVEHGGLSGGSRIWQLQKENQVIEGYGATIRRHVGQISHIIYINASTINHGKHIRFRGFTLIGNGASGIGGTGENDCVYVGGAPAGVGGDQLTEAIPEDVIVEDNWMFYPRRNVVSVVAGSGIYIRNNYLDGLGAVILRCGVDVEANKYMADGSNPCRNVVVEYNTVRNCGGININHSFADGALYQYNDIEFSATGASGMGGGAGGAQFNDDRYRDGDRLGISAFDNGSGNITVRGDGDASLHDLGIHVGMWVQGNIRTGSGAAWPSGLVAPIRYAISWISADGTQFRLSQYYLFGEITSFGGAHTGTLDLDPVISDLAFLVFRKGQNSGAVFKGNTIRYTGLEASVDVFNISTFYDYTLEDNIVEMGLSTGSAIRASYGCRIRTRNNKLTGGVRGISATAVSQADYDGDRITRTTLDGMSLAGKFVAKNIRFLDCLGDLIDAVGATRAVMDNIINLPSHLVSTRGIRIASGVRPILRNCDMTGAGTSNATSINIAGGVTEPRVKDCWQWDGTWRDAA